MHPGSASCPFCLQQRCCGGVGSWEWDLCGVCVWERRAVSTPQPHRSPVSLSCPEKALRSFPPLCSHCEVRLLKDQAVVPPEFLAVWLEERAEGPEKSWCDPYVALLKEGESGQTPGSEVFRISFLSSPDGGEKTCSVDV